MTNMFYVGTVLIPTADYDALLLRCAATCTSPTNDNVTLGINASTYTIATAQVAKDALIDPTTLNWTINDSGGI